MLDPFLWKSKTREDPPGLLFAREGKISGVPFIRFIG
jgi:hypothetical protein